MSWWRRLLPYALLEKALLWQIVALMLAGVALEALKPWPMKLIVDNVITGKALPDTAAWLGALPGGSSPATLLGWLALATLLIVIALQAVRVVQGRFQARAGARMTSALAEAAFDHLQHLSLRFHVRRQTGDLLKRITTDCGCVRDMTLWVALLALTSFSSLVVMFVIMWRLDAALALVALAAAPPLALLTRVFVKPMTDRQYRQEELLGQTLAVAEQTLTALPVVQLFVREKHEGARFRRLSRHTVQAYLRLTASSLQFKVCTSGVTAFATSTIMLLGGFHVLRGEGSVGTLLVFLSYVSSLYAPLETLAYLSSGVAQASARARRVHEVMDADDVVREAPGARALTSSTPKEAGRVRLDHVTFGYEPERPVLHDICLDIEPGETVAIVGATGAGKSTLVALLPRLYDPWSGRVLLDELDVRDLTLDSLRASVALVPQEPFLLPLSIADNIAYGQPEATRSAVETAAMAAQADEFIRRLPRGFDTVLGERGVTLSGGERQRLSIARAILKDAPVLILDEPTSALDADTEDAMMRALENLMRHRTTLIIAHRLSTVRRAGRIVVLEDGRITESGSHDALMALGGPYRRLHDAHVGAAG